MNRGRSRIALGSRDIQSADMNQCIYSQTQRKLLWFIWLKSFLPAYASEPIVFVSHAGVDLGAGFVTQQS
jgi:hypothetical protein